MARLDRQVRRLAGAFALAAASAGSAQAQDVLWWTDADVGTNAIPGALTLLQATRPGLTFTQATSQGDFNTQLAGGGFELAIFGEQNSDVFDGSSPELATFLAGGGRILGATWLDGTMAAFFGAVGSTTNEASITGAGALFGGITPPVDLTNPGWGVFSQSYTGAGACLATYTPSGTCAAIVGNGGSTLLLGPLFDTYDNLPQGQQFVANAADYLLGGPIAAPEPSTYALMATGLLALGGIARRRARTTA